MRPSVDRVVVVSLALILPQINWVVMLTIDEAATIRAALRYWIDEMAQHRHAAQHYFDSVGAQQLTSAETKELLNRFRENELRFVCLGSSQMLMRAESEGISSGDRIATVILPSI